MNRSGPRRAAPALVAVAHGTADPAGVAAITDLIRQISVLRPGLEVAPAFLSNASPTLGDVLSAHAGAGPAPVVVPLLLNSGYHVRQDIPGTVSRHHRASPGTPVTPHLGPDARIIDILAERVRLELATTPRPAARRGTRIVLAAAGSRDPQAARETAAAARLLAGRLGRPVRLAQVTATAPSLQTVLHQVGHEVSGGRVLVATYLLAPGEFERRIHAAGRLVTEACVRVTAPLAPDPLLAGLVLERYDTALAHWAARFASVFAAA